MKLWQKSIEIEPKVESFTVGKDADFDLLLAPFDILGSIAHARMLGKVGLLEPKETDLLVRELQYMLREVESGDFSIEEGVEDVHSQVELLLTRRLGAIGKKIHSGRSRNDQVLVDIKLYLRHAIEGLVHRTGKLVDTLLTLSEQHKHDLLPGYTHLQVAMPSSFGLWFSAYAETLVEDLELMQAAWRIANKNPLGSGAGYGSSFPLDREMTTRLLGFRTLHVNVVNAQLNRGKAEKALSMSMAQMGGSLARMAMDICLYMSQNMGFVTFPDALTTGSSIMPHKKNPDVWELIRGKCNRLQALPQELALLMANLPSGYHREMQLTKEILFPAIEELENCLEMADFMLQQIEVRKDIMKDPVYQYAFSVEVLNKKVAEGVPFRDAYKEVAEEIASGKYSAPDQLTHTHTGSIGNLGLEEIEEEKNRMMQRFAFDEVRAALKGLLKPLVG
jgi:argininosuccinate lyase